jgi:hypothetical protein
VGFYKSSARNFSFQGIYAQGISAYAATYCGLQIYQFYGVGVDEEPVKDIAVSSSLKLLQNPMKSNHIDLIMTSPENNEAEIALYNRIGQRIKTFRFNGLKSGENRLRLDAKGFPAGIYFLKLNGKPAGKVVKIQ